jgi:glycosyltransferase involved in cell wall biosynthesis
VIATSSGAGAELVSHRQTGMLAQPGDARDLAAQVDWLLANPELHSSMRAAARAMYESRLTAAANYRQLMDIYRRAAEHRRPLGMTA